MFPSLEVLKQSWAGLYLKMFALAWKTAKIPFNCMESKHPEELPYVQYRVEVASLVLLAIACPEAFARI